MHAHTNDEKIYERTEELISFRFCDFVLNMHSMHDILWHLFRSVARPYPFLLQNKILLYFGFVIRRSVPVHSAAACVSYTIARAFHWTASAIPRVISSSSDAIIIISIICFINSAEWEGTTRTFHKFHLIFYRHTQKTKRMKKKQNRIRSRWTRE